MMNVKEEKLTALTRQREQLLRIKGTLPKNSKDYHTISAVITQHDNEIKKLLDK